MNRDHYRTPPELFAYMHNEYRFAADIAASAENALCPIYCDEKNNALATPWEWFAYKGDYVWCNPPYSNIGPWVEAAAENARDGVGCVMLVMQDQSVGWFRQALESCQEVIIVTGGRIAFLHPVTGKPANDNSKGSMFLVWHPKATGRAVTRNLDRSVLLGLRLPPKRHHTEHVLDMVE